MSKKDMFTLSDYIRVVASILILFIVFGVAGPALISSGGADGVIAGVFLIVLTVSGVWLIVSPWVAKIKRRIG